VIPSQFLRNAFSRPATFLTSNVWDDCDSWISSSLRWYCSTVSSFDGPWISGILKGLPLSEPAVSGPLISLAGFSCFPSWMILAAFCFVSEGWDLPLPSLGILYVWDAWIVRCQIDPPISPTFSVTFYISRRRLAEWRLFSLSNVNSAGQPSIFPHFLNIPKAYS